MITDTTYMFGVFIGLYLITYGPPYDFLNFFVKLYYQINIFQNICRDEGIDIKELQDEEPKPEKKYEDKYLDEIRKLNKEFIFDENEESLKLQKYLEIFKILTEKNTNKLNEIKGKLNLIKLKIVKYQESNEDEYCVYDENEDDEDFYLGETKEVRIQTLEAEQAKLLTEHDNILVFETNEGKEALMKQAEEESTKFIIDQRLEKLKNCFVLENTPLGNVLMFYDNLNESFKYYSDKTIPYRYLEVAGRKYIKQFNCRPIFVDMEEELKLSEEKWEKDKKEKEKKEEEEKRLKEEAIKNQKTFQQKKSVFAKFKQYNKNAGTGHVNLVAPPKNSIQNKSSSEKPENEKILLKDKANRYTYEGKFSNFSFIKKVDKKAVNKKFAMTFKDFKKMQENNK
jgi:hypothetical protein